MPAGSRRSSDAGAPEAELPFRATSFTEKLDEASRLSVGILSFHSLHEDNVDNEDNGEVARGSTRSLISHGGGLTSREATANFVIACVGSGVVVFPRTIADTGYVVGVLLFLATSTACAICGLLVATCCTLAEIESGKPPGSLLSYEAMVEACLGTTGKVILMISKNFYCCGLLVVYLLFESAAFATWIPWSEEVIRFVVVLPIFMALAMLKDLKAVAKLSWLGIGAAFSQVLCMEIGAVFGLFDSTPNTYTAMNLKIVPLGASIATFVFAFGSVATIPSIRSQMADCTELPRALRRGIVIVWVIYGSIMGIGYAGFGDHVADNMIDNITKTCSNSFECIMGSGSAISIIINLFVSAPTFMYCVISVFQASGKSAIHRPLSWPNVALRAGFVLAIALLSAVVPFAKQIIGLLSAVFGVGNILGFPLICYYTLRRRGAGGERKACEPAVHAAVFGIAIVTMIFGVYGGVNELIKKIQAGDS